MKKLRLKCEKVKAKGDLRFMGKKMEKYFKEKIIETLKESTISMSEISKCKKVLYATFGYHDSEPPHSVISRKVKEVSRNECGLWGAGVKEKNIKKIREFCESQDGPVYLLLKYTNSKAQDKTGEWAEEIVDINRLKEKGGYYKSYIDADGENIDLQVDKVFVKGKRSQNTAFYVENYFFLEESFNRKEILSKYEGRTHNSDVKKSGEDLFKQSACYLLEKKEENKERDFKNRVERKAWGIVLKLKAPYIVLCTDYVEPRE